MFRKVLYTAIIVILLVNNVALLLFTGEKILSKCNALNNVQQAFSKTRIESPPAIVHNSRSSSFLQSSASESFKVLPKRLIAVFGPESSGSTFTASTLATATGASKTFRTLDFRTWNPSKTIEVQHFSLPQGWGVGKNESNICHDQVSGTEPSNVAVVVPAPCMSWAPGRPDKILKTWIRTSMAEACRDEAGIEKLVQYPKRYYLNITSHVQWYRARGVEATAVLMMRDSSISQMGKVKHHCQNNQVAEKQNRYAKQIMNEAIDKLEPSSEFVLVSYEGIMSLQKSYLFNLYRQLGINSTYVPDFKDGNKKYVGVPKQEKKNQ